MAATDGGWVAVVKLVLRFFDSFSFFFSTRMKFSLC